MRLATGLGLLACCVGSSCGKADEDPPTPSPERRPGEVRIEAPALKLLEADTADLKRTTFLAHPDLPIPEGKNALWCATWQLAWDAMRRDVNGGADLRVGPPAPEGEVKLLNGSSYPEKDLDPAARVAMAGWMEKGIVPAIRKELARKFPEGTMPIEFPDGAGPLAFGYLKKRLPFRIPFEPVRWDLPFEGTKTSPLWFGMTSDSTNPRRAEILSQVRVLAEFTKPDKGGLFRVTPDRFVLEIGSADGRDRLLLAFQPAGDTLEAKWKDVQTQVAGSTPHGFAENDLLAIPKFHFTLRHDHRELLGAPLTVPGFAGPIGMARQVLDFRLDESGAKVESYALLAAGLPRAFIFHRPFLLALQEAGASRPYLLMWIANDELFATAKD